MKLLDEALRYAAAGIPVFPLHWIKQDGNCSCRRRRRSGSSNGRCLGTHHAISGSHIGSHGYGISHYGCTQTPCHEALKSRNYIPKS